MERLINCEELAEYLSVAPQTIRIWVSKKKIPFLKIGSTVRFSQSQIDEILENSKRKALK
jgi:excisionase family DNA binding protein